MRRKKFTPQDGFRPTVQNNVMVTPENTMLMLAQLEQSQTHERAGIKRWRMTICDFIRREHVLLPGNRTIGQVFVVRLKCGIDIDDLECPSLTVSDESRSEYGMPINDELPGTSK